MFDFMFGQRRKKRKMGGFSDFLGYAGMGGPATTLGGLLGM